MSLSIFFKFAHFTCTIIALCRKTVQYSTCIFEFPMNRQRSVCNFLAQHFFLHTRWWWLACSAVVYILFFNACFSLFSPHCFLIIKIFLLNLRFMYFCCFCVLFFFLHPQCSHIPYDKISAITYRCTLKELRYICSYNNFHYLKYALQC